MNYFSVNAVIGGGLMGSGDFPTPESLIRHLDYIGVDRTLVYSMNALDRSPINGNKKLLDEIASYPDRLIPSFVISPADYYENGSIAYLREKAKSGEVRAFRLSTAFRMKNYERVIAELEAMGDPRGAILRMTVLGGMTHAEVADRLDIPLGTVKSHARRGLIHLREQLKEVTVDE